MESNQQINQSDKIKELLKKAQEQLEKHEYDECRQLIEQAYKLDQNDHNVLCQYGHILLMLEDFDKARTILYRAIELKPDENYQKYMEFAELNNGHNAVKIMNKGIEILKKIVDNYDENALNIFESQTRHSIDDYKKDLAQSYSALAEIYQTDLLNEPSSELNCKQNILNAINEDPTCLDAYLQFGNFFLNKDDESMAKKMYKHCFEEVQKLEQDDVIMNLEETEIVPFSFKLSLAKVLVEVDEYKDSLILLEKLVEEDETNLDVVYMMAFVNFKLQNYNITQEILNDIRNDEKVLANLKDDQELQQAFEELNDELSKIDFSQQKDDQMYDEKNNDDENEWMDLE